MIKIVAIAIVCALIIIYLKSINSELTMIATIGSGIILIYISIEYLAQAVDAINTLINISGIDKGLYSIIFKITAIGYLTEFGANIITDFGMKSLADKLIFVGKIIIFNLSLPIIYSVINLLVGIVQ